MNYLIWEHSDGKLYDFESEKGELSEVAKRVTSKLLGGADRSCDFEISISGDSGVSWDRFEYELCMSPVIYQTKHTSEVSDPRPQPKKL